MNDEQQPESVQPPGADPQAPEPPAPGTETEILPGNEQQGSLDAEDGDKPVI